MKNLYFESDNDFHNAIYPFKKLAKKWKKVDSFADVFRSSDKIDCIDDAKSTGSSKGDARKDCRKELGGNIFKRGAKVVALRPARGAFLGLLSINYRGMASRLNRAKINEPNIYEDALNKFSRLGGDKSSFEKSVRNGKDKKPLVCGDKCKDKINFSGEYFYNVEPVTTAVAGIGVGGTIALAMPIIVPILGIIKNSIANRQERLADEEEQENAKELYDKEIKLAEEQNKIEEQKIESDGKLINNVIIGSSVLVGLIITTVVVMKVVKKKRGNK